MTSFNLNCLLKDPISKYSPTEGGRQQMKFGWGHNSLRSKFDLPGNSERGEVIDKKVASTSCVLLCAQFILPFNKHLLSAA